MAKRLHIIFVILMLAALPCAGAESQSVSIGQAISSIFSESGRCFVVMPCVSGRVTLPEEKLPFDEALSAVKDAAGLSVRTEKGLYIISSGKYETARVADESGITVRVGLSSSLGTPKSLTLSFDAPFCLADAASGFAVNFQPGEFTFNRKPNAVEVCAGDEPVALLNGPVRVAALGVAEVKAPRAKYKRYRGVIEVRPGSSAIVNELPLEDYVRGVIPVEVPAKFRPEAQKALAVAIRTYAIRQISSTRHKAGGFDLCDSTDCQGFAGVSKDAPWVDDVIRETRGKVITYNREPIWATYSSDCGGITQNNEDAGITKTAWPYLRSVVDNPGNGLPDYCAGSPGHTWSKVYSLDELTKIFSRYRDTRVGAILSVEFAEFDCSGRVKKVVITGDKKTATISGTRLRDMFGPSVIKSARMTISPISEDGKYTLSGMGFGHGLGMCQFGANGYAEYNTDATYTDIIKHYYTGVEITRLGDLTAYSGK